MSQSPSTTRNTKQHTKRLPEDLIGNQSKSQKFHITPPTPPPITQNSKKNISDGEGYSNLGLVCNEDELLSSDSDDPQTKIVPLTHGLSLLDTSRKALPKVDAGESQSPTEKELNQAERTTNRKKPVQLKVPEIFVVSPVNYPSVVIEESQKTKILGFLNDSVRARTNRGNKDDIIIDKIVFRSGSIVIYAGSQLSARWCQFTLSCFEDEQIMLDRFTDAEIFPFAQSFTVWVPYDEADFEYVLLKVARLKIETGTWRYVRTIVEKKRSFPIGKKFLFISDGSLLNILDGNRELRFSCDMYQLKGVIKASGLAAPIDPNGINAFNYRKRIDDTQKAFEDWLTSQSQPMDH